MPALAPPRRATRSRARLVAIALDDASRRPWCACGFACETGTSSSKPCVRGGQLVSVLVFFCFVTSASEPHFPITVDCQNSLQSASSASTRAKPQDCGSGARHHPLPSGDTDFRNSPSLTFEGVLVLLRPRRRTPKLLPPGRIQPGSSLSMQ